MKTLKLNDGKVEEETKYEILDLDDMSWMKDGNWGRWIIVALKDNADENHDYFIAEHRINGNHLILRRKK